MKKFLIFLLFVCVLFVWAWNHFSSEDLLKWSADNKSSKVSDKVDYYVGMYNYLLDKKDRANSAFSQLLANHTTSQYAPLALFRRADAYRVMNDYSDALKDFENFVEIYPDHSYARLARRNIELIKSR